MTERSWCMKYRSLVAPGPINTPHTPHTHHTHTTRTPHTHTTHTHTTHTHLYASPDACGVHAAGQVDCHTPDVILRLGGAYHPGNHRAMGDT